MDYEIKIKSSIPKFEAYLKQNWLGLLLGFLLCIIGLYFFKLFLILLGIIILNLVYNSSRNQRDIEVQELKWYNLNKERIMIYYATKKSVQQKFKKLLNEQKIYETEIYYEGPKIKSTIPIPNSLKHKISRNGKFHQSPVILKVENGGINSIIGIEEIKDLPKSKDELIQKLGKIKAVDNNVHDNHVG